MQFQIGDRVVHRIHGVGTVRAIRGQRFAGDRRCRTMRSSLRHHRLGTVDGEGPQSLRAIVPKTSLAECRRLLMSEPVVLDQNHKLRQAEISTRLKDGSLLARCAIVRDLRALSRFKALGEAEDALLSKIARVVCEEWAASAGIAAKTAMQEIESLLARASRIPDPGVLIPYAGWAKIRCTGAVVSLVYHPVSVLYWNSQDM